ncbi:MAG: ABC transporter substrate-binding protein [Spirochaetota bacterium]
MKLHRIVTCVVFLLLTAAMAFAAGDQEKEEGVAEIQFSISPREVGKVIPSFIEGFEAENPDVKVDWLQVPGVPNEQHTLYVTKMASQDSQPDVLALDVIWPGEFIANGWAEPLNQYMDSADFDQYLDGMMNAVTLDGEYYGVPLYTNAIHLFYRKDLLDKYDHEVPQTWEELIATAEDITEKEQDPDLNGYISMWAQIEGLFMNYLQFMWGAGGSFFDENGTPTIDTPAAKEALQTMVDMVDDGVAPESILTYKPNDAMALFRQERAVFMVVQDFVWPMLNDDDSPVKGKVGMTRVPYFEGNSDADTVCMGGWILTINPYSENKEAAAEFIKYITNEENAFKMAVETGSMPARKDMQSNEALFEEYPIAEQLYADFAVGDVRPSAAAGKSYPELSHIMQSEIHAALTGQKSVDKALAAAQSQIEKLLE